MFGIQLQRFVETSKSLFKFFQRIKANAEIAPSIKVLRINFQGIRVTLNGFFMKTKICKAKSSVIPDRYIFRVKF